jgi:hypothetical protein
MNEVEEMRRANGKSKSEYHQRNKRKKIVQMA